MAENRYIFTFTVQKDKSQFTKVAKKVESAYKKAKVNIIELGGGRCRKTGVYTLDVWPSDDVEHLGLKNALTYLHSLPSEDLPYVRLEFDQTEEPYFYILLEGKLTGFDSESELKKYISKHGKPSVEKDFYDQFGNNKSTLFLKLSFKRKSDIKELYDATTTYIRDKTPDNLILIKYAVDNLYSKHNPQPVYKFPQLNYGFPNIVMYERATLAGSSFYEGSMEQVGCLCFSTIEKKDLYLGFQFNGDRVIEFSSLLIGGGTHQNVVTKEDIGMVSFVESLWESRFPEPLQGKFTNFNSEETKEAGRFVSYDISFMFAPGNLLPSQIWP